MLLALVARHYTFTADNDTEWGQAIGKVPKVSLKNTKHCKRSLCQAAVGKCWMHAISGCQCTCRVVCLLCDMLSFLVCVMRQRHGGSAST